MSAMMTVLTRLAGRKAGKTSELTKYEDGMSLKLEVAASILTESSFFGSDVLFQDGVAVWRDVRCLLFFDHDMRYLFFERFRENKRLLR
jgi:hypothetical protein